VADYVTIAELKTYLGGMTRTTDDDSLDGAIKAACREIDGWCRRTFTLDLSASARQFTATDGYLVAIDDAASITSVQTDTNGDGTATSTITSYQTIPTNGAMDGLTGWPTTALAKYSGGTAWPLVTGVPTVHVTARWGWPNTPDAVRQATLIVAAELFKTAEAPLGITDSIGEYGALRLGKQITARAARLLHPYRRLQLV